MTMRLLHGDCREVLAALPANSVHCVVTSPPYWGLRDYGVAGQIGLEATPDEYVAKLVAVFGEVRRVLRPDGVCWLNLGDCYAAGSKHQMGRRDERPEYLSKRAERFSVGCVKALTGGNLESYRDVNHNLKPKDLVGIPWRVAFALQADGWYLRSDVIWAKPNPMPESVRDRPTKAHEYIFLLTKSAQYFWNQEAVKEPAVRTDQHSWTDGGRDKQRGHSRRHAGFNGRYAEKIKASGAPATRNLRSVWTIATAPFAEAHFATFPPQLAETCIKSGCPAGGTVLDPFAGAGTTLLVADRLGRDAIGIELNPDYVGMIHRRLGADRGPLLEAMSIEL